MQGFQQTLSVEDYTRRFVKKIVKDEKYRDANELQSAGLTFYSLLQRFAREGDREDVRTPFKIIKDEFMHEWVAEETREAKEELIRRLFGVLDTVHEECQTSVQNCINGTDVSHTILEEFRLRLTKMVVGETWKDALPLRIEALKHMHKYRNRELDGYYTQEARKNTLKHRARHLTVKKLKRSVVGPSKSSWTAVFNDLLLTSGSKLAPLLFAVLDENQEMEDRLLSMGHPRCADTMSLKGSELSGSTVSSSSVRMPISDADTLQPTTDEDGPPYYYKNLNSELNAKLQLFKQKGLMFSRAHGSSHGSGASLQPSSMSPFLEDALGTTKSEEIGDHESHLQNGVTRSVTPLLDETPPPWCLSEIDTQLSKLQLSDGDGDVGESPTHALSDHPVQRPGVRHSSSVKTQRVSHPGDVQHLMKAPSCNAAAGFSFASPSPAKPPPHPLLPQDFASSHLCPFGDLDPFKNPEINALNKP